MSEINPYAAPASDAYLELVPPQAGGVWCDGLVLVMRRDALLPDSCIKCNLPAGGRRLPRKLYWHPPLVNLALLLWIGCGPLPYIILALIFRQKAKVNVGLCVSHLARRRRAIIIGWSLALSGAASFVAGILDADDARGPWMILAGVVLILAGAIYGVAIAAVIAAKRIDKQYVFIKRAGRQYLAQFPPWTRDPPAVNRPA